MIGDKELALPGKMLDLLATNHRLSAHNIANAGVQGFKPLRAQFTSELARAIEANDPSRIQQASIQISESKSAMGTESEIAAMSKNELLFNTFSEIASFRMRMLRSAITSR